MATTTVFYDDQLARELSYDIRSSSDVILKKTDKGDVYLITSRHTSYKNHNTLMW